MAASHARSRRGKSADDAAKYLLYDHRVVDGAAAGRFLNRVIDYLQSPGKLRLRGKHNEAGTHTDAPQANPLGRGFRYALSMSVWPSVRRVVGLSPES